MATIGLRYAVAAPIKTETRGQDIEYDKGAVVGRAISANISWERNNTPLNADDMEVANDNSVVGGSIDFNIDTIVAEGRKLLFGDYEDETNEGEWEDETDSAPYVGFGFFCSVLNTKTNKTEFQAMWLHKVQFGQTSETYQTKGQNVQYQTPTVTGNIMGVYNNTDEKPRVRRRKTFASAAEATKWLNEKANITTTGGT